ncbi:MAG: response regulator [Stagnimonas sp.]|nr:response regulator [Stagnimonas sp.]
MRIQSRLLLLALLPVPIILVLSVLSALDAAGSLRDARQVVVRTEQLTAADALFQRQLRQRDRATLELTEQSRGLEALLFGDQPAEAEAGPAKQSAAEDAARDQAALAGLEQQLQANRDSGLEPLLEQLRGDQQALAQGLDRSSFYALLAQFNAPMQRHAALPAQASSLATDAVWSQRFSSLAALVALQEALAKERLLVRQALTTLQVEPALARLMAATESRIESRRALLAAVTGEVMAAQAITTALAEVDRAGRGALLVDIGNYAQRSDLEAQLLEVLGYGGFIQSFKDYQLGRDSADLSRARTQLATAQEILHRIAALPMADSERADVGVVDAALRSFANRIEQAGGAAGAGEFNRAGEADAVAALQRLRSFRPTLSAGQWDSITATLQQQLAEQIRQTLARTGTEALARQGRTTRLTLAIALAVGLTLLLILLAGRQLFQRLSGGIDALVREFQRVTDTGDVRTRMVVHGQDELAELNRYFLRLGESLASYQEDNARAQRLGEAQLSVLAAIRAGDQLAHRAESMLACLREQTGAVVGAVYVEGEQGLHLVAAAGLPKDHDLSAGELASGLVGLASRTEGTRVLENLPAGYLRLSSASGSADAPAVSLTSLRAFGKLVGVLELAWLRAPEPEARELLDRVAEPIGIALAGTLSRARTEALLKETQVQSELLQQQQEELRCSNEELAEQTAVLRQSEEELKAQREELQANNEELEESAQVLQTQRARLEQTARDLEQATQYKSDFLANMSHELRTPLNSLLILARQLAQNEEGNLNAQQMQAAQIIHSGGKDLLTLINDILDLSKVEAGKMDLHVEPLDVPGLLEDLHRQFDPVARDRGVPLLTEIEPGLTAVLATDRNRLQQILRNLLANAFKFTSQGQVRLRIGRPPAELKLRKLRDRAQAIAFSVEDSGIGIPADKLEQIFEAFQQADGSTSRRYGGTGLGLSIARQLSQLLGGEVLVRSEPGVGSCFTVVLPEQQAVSAAAGSSEDATRAAPPAAAPPTPTAPPLRLVTAAEGEIAAVIEDDRGLVDDGRLTILVIEDDLHFAAIVRDLVRKQGYRCLVAGDARSGIGLAKRHRPAAIILDLGLPDSQGLSVLETLKYSGATRHIPVHVVSASEPSTEALRRGAIGYLHKPTDIEGLMTALGRLQGQIDRGQRTVLVVEDDRSNQVAMRTLLENEQTRVLVAGTGVEAMRLLLAESIDCLVLDLSLPDTDGLQFLEQLKADSSLPQPPVIIYTGRDLSEPEHRRLAELSQSIVIKGAASPERLLDEVVLFLHEVEEQLPSEQRQIVSRLHRGTDAFAGKKLLVVDDDLRNTFALSSALKQRGFEVIIADNGQLALERLAEHEDIDAVLMDLMMPVMDGLEAMRHIRAQPRLAQLPVIALTARAMGDDRQKCIEAGASDYLSKPVDIDQLLAMLRVWLGRAA